LHGKQAAIARLQHQKDITAYSMRLILVYKGKVFCNLANLRVFRHENNIFYIKGGLAPT